MVIVTLRKVCAQVDIILMFSSHKRRVSTRYCPFSSLKEKLHIKLLLAMKKHTERNKKLFRKASSFLELIMKSKLLVTGTCEMNSAQRKVVFIVARVTFICVFIGTVLVTSFEALMLVVTQFQALSGFSFSSS